MDGSFLSQEREEEKKRSRFLQTDDRSVWACRLGGACGHDEEMSVGCMA